MSPALSEEQREAVEELVQEQAGVIEQAKREAIKLRVMDLATETLDELADRGFDTSQEYVKKSAIQAAKETLFGSDDSDDTVEISVAGRQNSSTDVSLDTDESGPEMITEEVEIPVAGRENSKYAEPYEVERIDPRSISSTREIRRKSKERRRANQEVEKVEDDDIPSSGLPWFQ